MIKALSATAIVSLLAAAVTFLPGFAPRVEASGADLTFANCLNTRSPSECQILSSTRKFDIASGPSIPTFANTPAGTGCECWNRTTSVPHAMAKGDRLDIRPVGRACSEQAWPNFEAACLRRAGARTTVMTEARLVSTDRR